MRTHPLAGISFALVMAASLALGVIGCDEEPMPSDDPSAPVFVFGGQVCAPQAACDGICCPAVFDWLRCQIGCLDELLMSGDEEAGEACVLACATDAAGCGELLLTIAECSICSPEDERCDPDACCEAVERAF